jgi:hypothetical protein
VTYHSLGLSALGTRASGIGCTLVGVWRDGIVMSDLSGHNRPQMTEISRIKSRALWFGSFLNQIWEDVRIWKGHDTPVGYNATRPVERGCQVSGPNDGIWRLVQGEASEVPAKPWPMGYLQYSAPSRLFRSLDFATIFGCHITNHTRVPARRTEPTIRFCSRIDGRSDIICIHRQEPRRTLEGNMENTLMRQRPH